METSSDDYFKAQDVSQMIMGETDGEINETPRSRKKRKVTRKVHRKMRAQTREPEEPFPSLFISKADVFNECRLRGKLEAVGHSVLKSYF